MVAVKCGYVFAGDGVFTCLLQLHQETRSGPITAGSSRARCSKS